MVTFTYPLLREDNPDRIKQLALAINWDNSLFQSIEVDNYNIRTKKPLSSVMYDNLSRQGYIAPIPTYDEAREIAWLLHELGEIALPEIDSYLVNYGFEARNILFEAIRWPELPRRLHDKAWRAVNRKYIQLTLPLEVPIR